MSRELDRSEHRARAPARLLSGLYRLVKACALHGDANEAVLAQGRAAESALVEYCTLREAETARLVFARDVAFVNRRLVKGSRDVMTMAQELGALLRKAGANEVVLERTTTGEALARFARLVVVAQRGQPGPSQLVGAAIGGITARWLEHPDDDVQRELVGDTTLTRVVRNYAASVLLVQQFYRELDGGAAFPSMNRVKHVAHKIVSLLEGEPQLVVALAAARLADADRGRLAVSTAAIAVATARQLTDDRAALAALALAALVADVARVRLGDGASGRAAAVASVWLLTVAGGLHDQSLQRAVLVHEALGGAEGREPTVLAGILAAVRRLNELRAPVSGSDDETGLDVVIEVLRSEARDEAGHALIDLLVSGLGFYPTGTLVELTTGEMAVVVGAPSLSVDFARPRVRVLADRPFDVDLASAPKPGAPARAVRRALAASPADLDAVQRVAFGRGPG